MMLKKKKISILDLDLLRYTVNNILVAWFKELGFIFEFYTINFIM